MWEHSAQLWEYVPQQSGGCSGCGPELREVAERAARPEPYAGQLHPGRDDDPGLCRAEAVGATAKSGEASADAKRLLRHQEQEWPSAGTRLLEIQLEAQEWSAAPRASRLASEVQRRPGHRQPVSKQQSTSTPRHHTAGTDSEAEPEVASATPTSDKLFRFAAAWHPRAKRAVPPGAQDATDREPDRVQATAELARQ